MSNYVLSCCSTADLSQQQFDERDIKYICFHFELDGKQYPDDLGKTMPFDKFYKAMVDGAMTKTSQVNVDEFTEYFKKFLDAGQDILHLSLSSGISGVFNSASIAADELREKYPERKIYVMDSLSASSGYGMVMDKLADLRDEGKSLDEVYQWALDNRLKANHWFFTTDLTFLIRGGRVSKLSGWFGTVLKICPLLNVSFEGKLVAREKIRGKAAVIRAIEQKMEELAEDGTNYSGKCFISNAACYDDAKAVADLIEQSFPKLNGKVIINSIGTTIGSHTGPGTVALFFWGAKREN